MNKNYKKAPEYVDRKNFTQEVLEAVKAEIYRFTSNHNYVGAFNYAMKIHFKGTAKEMLEKGLKFYKDNKLEISYNQLKGLGIEKGFEKEVEDITSKFK